MSSTNWTNFMAIRPVLKKRQQITNEMSRDQLYALCPVNQVNSADVAAGCIAGVYQKFCTNPADLSMMAECRNAYNRILTNSAFKVIGEACPTWMSGPRSANCAQAISNFRPVVVENNIILTADTARQFVENILARPKFAPCVADSSRGVKCTNDGRTLLPRIVG
jgi:hypothetical protein